jgi:diguanylate cyclase (GGDEF)-like protein
LTGAPAAPDHACWPVPVQETGCAGSIGTDRETCIPSRCDISERKLAERRIEHLAGHDPLTGIPNRRRFCEPFGETLARARRCAHRFALLFVDLDRFKAINDGYGHLVGDRLLVEAPRRMHGCLRASDTLGRRGGDEFVVLLPEIDAARDAEAVAEKIRVALAQPFVLDGRELCISTSIGIVLYPEHGDDEDTLVRHADEAMYRAKSEGRNRTAPSPAECAARRSGERLAARQALGDGVAAHGPAEQVALEVVALLRGEEGAPPGCGELPRGRAGRVSVPGGTSTLPGL